MKAQKNLDAVRRLEAMDDLGLFSAPNGPLTISDENHLLLPVRVVEKIVQWVQKQQRKRKGIRSGDMRRWAYALIPCDDGQMVQLVRHELGDATFEGGTTSAKAHMDAVWDVLTADRDFFELSPQTCAASDVATKLRSAAKPMAYGHDAPPLRLSHKALGSHEVSITDLGNLFNTGMTGAGKTTVVVNPIVKSIMGYRADNFASAALIIDPKAELKETAVQAAKALGRTDDLLIIGENAPILHAFSEHDGKNLRERLYDARRFIGDRTISAYSAGDTVYWDTKSVNLVVSFLELNQVVTQRTRGTSLFARLLGTHPAVSTNRIWPQLAAILEKTTDMEEMHLFSTEIDILLLNFNPNGLPKNPLRIYTEIDPKMGLEQAMYVVRNANNWVTPLAEAEETGLVNLNPYPKDESPHLNVEACCDAGKVIIYQPGTSNAHNLIARVLKTQYFEAVTHRKNLLRPQFYVVDEFQRFVTHDETTGEHAFLERCRAYRCNAILATQSVSALYKVSDVTAANAIFANCRTKVFMRNTDESTQALMRNSLPAPPLPWLPHVSVIRPLCSLRVGQSYWVLNERWGISQYTLPAAA